MAFAEIRLRSPSDLSSYTILRNVSNLSYDAKYNDIGAISFDIPMSDADYAGLSVDSIVEVCINGTSNISNMWYGIEGVQFSKTTDGAIQGTFSGKSLINWLADCIVYPSTWPSVPTQNPDGTTATVIQGHSFENASPGNIIRTLIARGVERGGLQWLTCDSFTGSQTSGSQAWTATLSTTYSNGTSLLQVVQDMAAQRLIDFQMVGNDLRIYNYGDTSTTYTPEQVMFRRGKNLTEQTRTLDSSSAASVVLVVGDLSAVTESGADQTAAAQTAIGRRKEFFLSEGGLTDIPTLQMLANTQLEIIGHILTEDTLGVTDLGDTVPWENYNVGDWVWAEFDGNAPVSIQIRQIAATQQDNGDLQIGVVLGDIIADRDEKNQLLLNNIASGNGALPNQNNFIGPSAPTGIDAVPSAYRDANGRDFVQVAVSWTAPSTNQNGTTLTNLDHYEIQYQLGTVGDTWVSTGNVPATASPLAAFISQLPPGQTFTAQVRAVDSYNNFSPWDTMATGVTLPQYSQTLEKPSTPTVLSIIQGLAVSWDGLDDNGLEYDSSFSQINIYVSTTSGFTPDPSNLYTAMTTRGGTVSITGLSYNTDYYVEFIALDKSGNQSPVSASSTAAQASKVGSNDATNIGVNVYTQSTEPTGAINTNDLWIDTGNNNAIYVYNGSVWTIYQFGTGAISANSVDASKIVTAGLAASVIATGTLSAATITMGSGSAINIGSPGSNGVQISPSGITAWNASSQSFNLSSSGVLTLKGSITSGSTITGTTITGTTLQTTPSGYTAGINIGGFGVNTIGWYWNNGGTPQEGNSISVDSGNLMTIDSLEGITLNATNGVVINSGTEVTMDTVNVTLMLATSGLTVDSGTNPNVYGSLHINGGITTTSLISIGTSLSVGTTIGAGGNITSGATVTGRTFQSSDIGTVKLVQSYNGNIAWGSNDTNAYIWVGGSEVAHVNSAGSFVTGSAESIKTDIATLTVSDTLADKFRLVKYTPKTDATRTAYGVIADELAKDAELDQFVEKDGDSIFGVSYDRLALATAYSVNQKLNNELKTIKDRLDVLEKK